MLERDGAQGDRVEEVWAFVGIDSEDDCEGIVALPMNLPGFGVCPMPAVAADRARVEMLRPGIEAAAKVRGDRIRLVRFSNVEEVEVIEP